MAEKKRILKGQKLSFRNIGMDKLLYVLLAGAALLILSIPTTETSSQGNLIKDMGQNGNAGNQAETTFTEKLEITEDTYEMLVENRLEEMLSCVQGAGRVKVMVTLKASGEKIILTEAPYTKSTMTEQDSSGGNRNTVDLSQSDTVVYIEDSQGTRTPYQIQETAPEIEGILVIAQGAGENEVQKELNAAITALFDLPSHKIKICRMAD